MAGSGDGGMQTLGVRPIWLTERIVGEVEALHRHASGAAAAIKPLSGRRARRSLRAAREAESDMLRVLGFDSYADFAGAVGKRALTAVPGRFDASIGKPAPDVDLVEAQNTEAALLRVLHRLDDDNGPARRTRPHEAVALRPVSDEPGRGVVDELRGRVAAFEEELAESRFELRSMRDELRGRRRSSPENPPAEIGGLLQDTATGLAQAAAELRALGELLRAERAELVAFVERARSEAERTLEQARVEAEATRENAAADARRVFERALDDAVATTRAAFATIDDSRRTAPETASAVEPSEDAER
ncbi:MAG TPA: hypothetical protein VGP92_12590 [Acidimicrobiia bacterium]|nr:hypothetical protein [Acidimicrobiia bacterium]